MRPPAGTGPHAAGLFARERLERHGVGTLSDAELLTILAGPAGSRAADAVLGECGAVQTLPQESAGDLARIHGVTPRAAAFSAGRIATAQPPRLQTSPSSSVRTPS